MMTETVVTVQEAPNNNAAKPQAADSQIKINLDYFKTTPGLLKIVEFILGILCMALASPAHGGVHYFLFVATTSFILTALWIIVYLLGLREAITLPINWLLTEFFNTGLVAALYVIAFIVQVIAAVSYHYGPYIAAAIFGFFNACAYSLATYLLHIEWKSSRTTN